MSYRNYTPTRITKYHLTLCSIVVVHSSIHDLHNDKDQKTHQKSSNLIPAESWLYCSTFLGVPKLKLHLAKNEWPMAIGYVAEKKYISYSKIHLTRRVFSPLSINIQNSIVKYNFQEMTYWSTNKNKNNYTISIIIIVWERSHFRDLFRAVCWSGSGLLRVWNRYWNHFGYY